MKDWIPVKTEPMTEEEIKLYADDYELNPGDPEAVTFRNPMPEDGEVIWITTEKGEVLKTECVNDKGIYWLVDHDWSQVLAWMPVEIPKPYRAPDPRLIDATQLLKAIDTMTLTPDGGVDINDLESLIKRQPTLDQRKTALLKIDAKSKVITCGGCGAQIDMLPVSSYYCPICGAKWGESKK